jgi:hypothetical protein
MSAFQIQSLLTSNWNQEFPSKLAWLLWGKGWRAAWSNDGGEAICAFNRSCSRMFLRFGQEEV